jgi:serine/threonine protein kinase
MSNDSIKIIKKIRSGAYGSVFKAYDPNRSEYIAIKRMNHEKHKKKKSIQYGFSTIRECFIFSKFEHPNIIPHYNITQTPKCVDISMLLADGDLISLMHANKNINFKIPIAKKILWKMLEVLGYFHSNKIIHRDIKPGNILYATNENTYNIYLADFGGAKYDDGEFFTPDGIYTEFYCAPELKKYKNNKSLVYNHKVDIYSLGCTIIHFLHGSLGKNKWKLFEDYKLTFPNLIQKLKIPSNFKNLLTAITDINPRTRLTACECLQHDLFNAKYYNIPTVHADYLISPKDYMPRWPGFSMSKRHNIIKIMFEAAIRLKFSTMTLILSKYLFDYFMKLADPQDFTKNLWTQLCIIAITCLSIIATFKESSYPSLPNIVKEFKTKITSTQIFEYQSIILQTVNYIIIVRRPPQSVTKISLNKINNKYKQKLFE